MYVCVMYSISITEVTCMNCVETSNLCITDAAFIELTRENEQHKDELTLHGELITDIYHYKCALTQLTLTYFIQYP